MKDKGINLLFNDDTYFIHVDRYNHTLYKWVQREEGTYFASVEGYFTTLVRALKRLSTLKFLDEDYVNDVNSYLVATEEKYEEVFNSENWQTIRGSIKSVTNRKNTI